MREKSRPERTLFDTYRGRDHPASSSFRVPHREPYYPMWEQNFYDRPPVNRYLTIGPSRSKRDSKNVMYLRPLSPDLDYYYRTRMLNRPIYEAKVESGRKRREKDRSATTSKAVKKKIERKYSSSSASTPVPVKLKIRKPKKTTRPVETTDHASSLSDSTSPPPPSTPPRPRKKRTVKKKPIETKASTTETFLSALDANRLQTVGKEEVSRIAEDFGQEPVSGQRNKQWVKRHSRNSPINPRFLENLRNHPLHPRPGLPNHRFGSSGVLLLLQGPKLRTPALRQRAARIRTLPRPGVDAGRKYRCFRNNSTPNHRHLRAPRLHPANGLLLATL